MSRRVLQVVLSLNPGGTERLVIDLVTRLNEATPMAVCCLDEPGTWAEELRARGVRVSAIHRSPGFRWSAGRQVAKIARAHGAHVLHCHHYSPFVYGSLARAWAPGLRVLFTEHGRLSDAPPSAKRRLANGVLSRVPQRVFTVSEDLKRHLVAEGFPPRGVQTIYNGITIGERVSAEQRDVMRRALGVSRDTLVLGTIARLDPVKDLGTLIKAMPRLTGSTPALLMVVGDGPERHALETSAAASSAAGQIRFVGHQDRAREWLAACDVYVNCSVSEGISLTILEAMAAGLPIVATRVGGTPEVVTGDCGRLIPPRNADVLGDELVEIARAPEVRRRMGNAARERACRHFSIERMVDAYRQVYETV